MIVLPQGTDACRIHGGALIPQPAETEKARAHWDRNVKIFWDALDEDFQMAQAIQRGFRSGANSHITFGRFEQGCAWRSEEHTSELQSLMRISYAVFCLKKKIHDS